MTTNNAPLTLSWEPILTVITPVFNGARFIESCLTSVQQQCCPQVEHLVVDGASNDGTQEIVARYSSSDPRIRLHSAKDYGQSDAMNTGLRLARGTIVSILNVDDFYAPGALQRVIGLFQDFSNPSLLVGNCRVLDDAGDLVYVNRPARISLFHFLAGFPFPVNPSAYFYHRTLHDQIGGYDVTEHYAMDLDFLCRAVMAANVHYIDETLGNYRRIAGTKSVSDRMNGLQRGRARRIYAHHRRSLPMPLNIAAFAAYPFVRNTRRAFNLLAMLRGSTDQWA